VDVAGLHSLSGSELKYDFALQTDVANITYWAIAEIALADYGVDGDSFYVDYYSVSGDLSIEFIVFAQTDQILNVLMLILQNEDESSAIEAIIESKLDTLFVSDHDEGAGMAVSIGIVDMDQNEMSSTTPSPSSTTTSPSSMTAFNPFFVDGQLQWLWIIICGFLLLMVCILICIAYRAMKRSSAPAASSEMNLAHFVENSSDRATRDQLEAWFSRCEAGLDGVVQAGSNELTQDGLRTESSPRV